MISKIKDYIFGMLNDRNTRSIVINVIYAFGVRGLSMFVGLFTTPMYIRYFNNNELLGIWFTLLSVLTWILYCDMGIGNGLRNKLVAAMQSEDKLEGKRYVSSAYLFICSISLVVVIVLVLLSQFIDWNIVFNVDYQDLDRSTLQLALAILLASIAVQLVLRLITSVLYALQQSFVPGLLNLLTNVLMLAFASIAVKFEFNGSIISMAIAYFFAVNVPLIVATIIVFGITNRNLCPSIKYYKKEYAQSTLKIGGVFLWIQFMALILNSTNSYFVTLFIGNEAVVDFNIYYKIFTLVGTLVTLISTPIWSATTKAQVEGNYQWLRKLFRKFASISALAVLAEFILVIPLQYVFDFWLGESSINVDYRIALIFAMFGSVMIWSSTITCFVNGLGELKLQSIFLTVGAIIDVLFTYIFAKVTNSYVAIVIANIFAFLPYLFIQTAWLIRFLKKKTQEV